MHAFAEFGAFSDQGVCKAYLSIPMIPIASKDTYFTSIHDFIRASDGYVAGTRWILHAFASRSVQRQRHVQGLRMECMIAIAPLEFIY